MTQERLTLGRQGEGAAVRCLQNQGMKIVERNLRTPVGEIDLVVKSKRILAFVEVKTRRGSAFGSPDQAVGPPKQRQIVQTAKWYLNDKPHEGLQPRFDVIAITVSVESFQVEHITDDFEV